MYKSFQKFRNAMFPYVIKRPILKATSLIVVAALFLCNTLTHLSTITYSIANESTTTDPKWFPEKTSQSWSRSLSFLVISGVISLLMVLTTTYCLAKRPSQYTVVLWYFAAACLSMTLSNIENIKLHDTVSDLTLVQEKRSLMNTSFTEIDMSFYNNWVEKIEAKMSASSTKEIYYTMSDYKYSGRFEELLHHSVKCFPNATLAVAAFDTETYDWFASRDVPTLLMTEGTIKERVMVGKFKGSLAILIKGWTLLFSEMDIYWRSTPMLNASLDFIAGQHKNLPHREINIGFYLARPTPEIVSIFARLSQWIDLPETLSIAQTTSCGVFDQRIMDLAVRGKVQDNAFISETDLTCILPSDSVEMLVPSDPINWDYISTTVLEHWEITQLDSVELAGVHVWSGMGPAHKQIEWAMENFVKNGRGM